MQSELQEERALVAALRAELAAEVPCGGPQSIRQSPYSAHLKHGTHVVLLILGKGILGSS